MVNSLLDQIKRIGAAAIIIVLIAMMGLMFSSQPLSEITALISGVGGIGSFGGQEISSGVAAQYYERCREYGRQEEVRAAQLRSALGDVADDPEFLRNFAPRFDMQNCMERSLKEVYFWGTVGERLKVGPSTQAIEAEVLEQAEEAYRNQTVLIEEDRRTVQSFYRTIMSYAPMDVRVLEARAQEAAGLLSQPVRVSSALVQAELSARQTGLELRLLRFSNGQILANLKTRIELTEDQIRRTFDEEQRQVPEESRRPYEEERPFVVERIKTELARADLDRLRAEFEDESFVPDLERLADLTGVAPETVPNLTLPDLPNADLGGGRRANLALPGVFRFLADAGPGATGGPFTDEEYTVFLQVVKVELPPVEAHDAEEQASTREELGQELTDLLIALIRQEELLRGEFQLTATFANE